MAPVISHARRRCRYVRLQQQKSDRISRLNAKHAYIDINMHLYMCICMYFLLALLFCCNYSPCALALSFCCRSFSLPRCDPKFASAICKFCALTQFEWHYIHILLGSLPRSLFSSFGCLSCCYYYYYCCCCFKTRFAFRLFSCSSSSGGGEVAYIATGV